MHGIRHKTMDEYIFIYNGNYLTVSGDYNNVPDIVENFGETLEDYFNGKYVMLNNEQKVFLESNPAATPVETFNMTEATEISEFDRSELISRIEEYGNSDLVKTFYVNNKAIWYDSETRQSISASITMEKEIGKNTTILWIDGTPYELTIEIALNFFKQIELYSKACYNVTQTHIAQARDLTLKEEIKTFDITEGYPEKLNFNL